jgi:5-methylcytosine-specific restriction protein A
MLVSCRYCNAIHERSYKCDSRPKAPTKELNNIVRFRNSSAWKRKRADIKARDNHLCQLCKLENKYTYESLDVHHITAISIDWTLRLEDYNLITLCKYHHFLADNGNIKRSQLYDITNSFVTVSGTAEK